MALDHALVMRLLDDGVRPASIARRLNCHRSTITRIKQTYAAKQQKKLEEDKIFREVKL